MKTYGALKNASIYQNKQTDSENKTTHNLVEEKQELIQSHHNNIKIRERLSLAEEK